MKKNTLFIVSSVIYLSSNPLCYSSTRSAFSAEKRAQQTLNTIESIRTTIPDAKILLIEMGLIKDLPYNIENKVDMYLYLGNKKVIRDAADGPYKGLGEVLGLYLADRWIRTFNADYYFKLSGRYYLKKEFNVNDWVADGYTGRDYFGGLYTVLYGFPNRLYENWRYSLRKSIPILLQAESLELIQPKHLDKPIHYLSKLEVSGWEAHSGSFVSL